MLTCDTSGTLTIFYYIKVLTNLLFIITPIILVVMCSVDMLGAVTGSYSKADALKKAWSNVIKRIIIAVIILILPILVSFVMSFVEIGSYDECYKKATKEIIERLEKEEEIKRKLEEERKKQEAEALKNQYSPNSPNINISGGPTKTVANALNIPYYGQCDSRWGNIVYDTSGATMCSSSCGYTSLAMVISGLSGTSVNPYTVVKDLRGISDGGKTSKGYGAASKSELTKNSYLSKYGIMARTISTSGIMSSLNAGNPVIILVPGHYLTLSRSSNGKIVVLDSFSGWASKLKGSGEYNSISQIENAYGAIEWAASYQK